jgi:hypothetical protein
MQNSVITLPVNCSRLRFCILLHFNKGLVNPRIFIHNTVKHYNPVCRVQRHFLCARSDLRVCPACSQSCIHIQSDKSQRKLTLLQPRGMCSARLAVKKQRRPRFRNPELFASHTLTALFINQTGVKLISHLCDRERERSREGL